MRRLTFKLMTAASFCLLIFSLYLNFLYKGGNHEFAPVKRSTTADSTTQVQTGSSDVLVKN